MCFFTHQSTAHIAVIKLCTKDVEMFLHFHAFLQALSGMGSLLTPALTSLKKPKEPPVVKITELNSIAENIGVVLEDSTGSLQNVSSRCSVSLRLWILICDDRDNQVYMPLCSPNDLSWSLTEACVKKEKNACFFQDNCLDRDREGVNNSVKWFSFRDKQICLVILGFFVLVLWGKLSVRRCNQCRWVVNVTVKPSCCKTSSLCLCNFLTSTETKQQPLPALLWRGRGYEHAPCAEARSRPVWISQTWTCQFHS